MFNQKCEMCNGELDTGFNCTKCGHRQQPNTGGTQSTDTQQLKAEIAAIVEVLSDDKQLGGGCVVNLKWLYKELQKLSAV